jgi:DNA-binding IclR family transcriptional regulator
VRGPQQVPVAALVVSAPVSRMTESEAGRVAAELLDRAAWLEGQLPGAT